MMRITPRLAVLLIPLLLGACTPPGKGPAARRGYERSAPVIAALEQYRARRGVYPDSLSALVPGFLPDSALRVPDGDRERYPLRYRRTADGYELAFRYTGPGMNTCTYTPAARWKCSGYF
jgi:hypothetical protein